MNLTAASRTVQLLKRICDTKSSTVPFCPPAAEKRSLSFGDVLQPFERVSPESQGIPSRHIRLFLEELQRGNDLNMQTVLIIRNGKLLCSAAYGAQRIDIPKHTFSACKSITALAIGLLCDDGLLHPDDSMSKIFPDLLTPAASRRMRDVTVKDLLTMRSGISFAEPQSASEEQWLQPALTGSLMTAPGKEFHYNSINTYLLSAIVRRITDESMSSFLQRRLFHPMGISGTLWECSPDGIEKGGWGLYIRCEDMAKLGQLILNGGEWNGMQLISREYLQDALSPHVSPPPELGEFDYGYQIWIGRKTRSFLFNGMLGQNVLGFPGSGILIVTNAGADTDYQRSRYFEIVDRYFGGGFADTLPPDPVENEALNEALRGFSFYSRKRLAIDETAQPFLYRSFTTAHPCAASTGLLPMFLQILHNNYSSGLISLAISTSGTLPELIYRERDETHRLSIGLGCPSISELCFRGNCFHVAVHGRFTHDEEDRPVFCIRINFLETPSVRVIKLILTDDGAILKQSETPGIPYLYEKLCAAARQPLLRPLLMLTAGGSDEEFLYFKATKILSPEIQLIQDNV